MPWSVNIISDDITYLNKACFPFPVEFQVFGSEWDYS